MKQELQVIMDLMKDLQDKMEYSPDDLSERLGRDKPKVEVMKIEAKSPDEESMEDPMVDKMESPMDESMESEDSLDMMDERPEGKLKKRLMKLRGY